MENLIKIAFRVYKLDISSFELNNVSIDEVPQKIVDIYNFEKEGVTFSQIKTDSGGCDLGKNKKVLFYRKNNVNSVPHAWKQFFKDGGVDFGDINTELHHIAGFIIDRDSKQLFAISTGQAYVIFERYIDYDFPINIARRIVQPEIKSGDVKGLAGYLQASSLQFRRPRRVSTYESVGLIWTTLSGFIREEVSKRESFTKIFGKRGFTSIEIKASVYIKKKLSNYSQLSEYIDWLTNIYNNEPIPVDSDDSFGFLDSVRKLNARKHPKLLIDLSNELNSKIKNRETENFDLCHRDYAYFLNADHYKVTFNRQYKIYDQLPSIDEIQDGFYDNKIDLNEFLTRCTVDAEYDSESYHNVSGNLKDLICCEISKGDKVYFLFNNEWYELREDFVELIRQDFQSITSNQENFSNLALPEWTQKYEGDYNASFDNSHSFIVGDKVFSENTELFDILHWDSTRLSIIHVKSGFGVKIRDVASQIFSAAQIIENDIRTGSKLLKDHYQKIIDSGHNPQIGLDEFLGLFKKPHDYILAYGTHNDVLKEKYGVRSNIAKLEMVQLKNDMKRFEDDVRLKLQWIHKIS